MLKKLETEYVQCQGFEHKVRVACWVNEEKLQISNSRDYLVVILNCERRSTTDLQD